MTDGDRKEPAMRRDIVGKGVPVETSDAEVGTEAEPPFVTNTEPRCPGPETARRMMEQPAPDPAAVLKMLSACLRETMPSAKELLAAIHARGFFIGKRE